MALSGDRSTRANEWTRVTEQRLGLDVERAPAYLYAHCRSVLGQILCDVGRWPEADVTLRLAGTKATHGGPRIDGKARAALAELRVLQGRLADAERLINNRRNHPDRTVALVSLHLLRGQHRDAAGVAELALHSMRDDRARASRLLVMLTEAQLALADVAAAETSVTRLEQLAAAPVLNVVAGRAALARGMLAQHRAQTDAARRDYEYGVRALADSHWPLLVAELQLRLGQVLADTDAPAAIAAARAAHLTWARLGSPRSACSAALLNRLGLQASSKPHATDPHAALSPRERTVLAHLRDGLPQHRDRRAAAQLGAQSNTTSARSWPNSGYAAAPKQPTPPPSKPPSHSPPTKSRRTTSSFACTVMDDLARSSANVGGHSKGLDRPDKPRGLLGVATTTAPAAGRAAGRSSGAGACPMCPIVRAVNERTANVGDCGGPSFPTPEFVHAAADLLPSIPERHGQDLMLDEGRGGRSSSAPASSGSRRGTTGGPSGGTSVSSAGTGPRWTWP
jgi:hypothetical protein